MIWCGMGTSGSWRHEVPNPQKQKGDRAEAAVRDFLHAQGFREAFRTRAGWDDDRGDVIVPSRPGETAGMAVQVKDVASPAWKSWMAGLADQIRNGRHRHGVIWWKRRGSADPGTWTVMMTGDAFVDLLEDLGYPREAPDGP